MASKVNQKNEDALLEEKINSDVDVLELCAFLRTEDDRTQATEALKFIRDEVKKSTEAMSAVPKPLKFMRPHFERVKAIYEQSKQTTAQDAVECQRLLADLLSVLSTTLPSVPPVLTDTGLVKQTIDAALENRLHPTADTETPVSLTEAHQKLVEKNKKTEQTVRPSVQFRLEGNASSDLMSFGHEYVRSLQMDILAEFQVRSPLRDDNDSDDDVDMVDVDNLPGIGRFDTNEKVVNELLEMSRVIVDDFFKSGSFIDATDLLLEVRIVHELPEIIKRYKKDVVDPLRVSEYLSQTAVYERTHDARYAAYFYGCQILTNAQLYSDALRQIITAYSAGILERSVYVKHLIQLVHATYTDEKLGTAHRHQIYFHLCHANLHRLFTKEEREALFSPPAGYEITNEVEEERTEKILGYKFAREHYEALYTELDLIEAKHPDDVYKTYLDNYSNHDNIDSASKNLASSYVSGFVHAGYKHDVIVNPSVETTATDTTATKGTDNLWIHKNKDEGGIAAAAAVMGALHLWDMDEGLNVVDPYISSAEKPIQAGGFIGWGLCCAQQEDDFDPLLAQAAQVLIEESDEDIEEDPVKEAEEAPEKVKAVDPKQQFVKLCALMSLGLGYGGSYKEDLVEIVEGVCTDTEPENLPLCYNAALTLGLSHVGSGDESISETLCQVILDLFTREESPLDKDYDAVFLAVGLALNYMGTGAASDTIGDLLSTMGDQCAFRKGALILLEACAYAGTNDVTIVQRFLRVISDGADVDKEDEENTEKEVVDDDASARKLINQDIDRRLAVLGIALVCLGDSVGQQMMLKYSESLIQHGDLPVVRTIPLALALTFASNPQNMVMDLLSKMAHDTDAETALTAIFSLSIVAAGTNNARAAKIFRQLALFYQKSAQALFLVRVGQGLVHLGKGILTISPMMYGGEAIRKVSLAHLLVPMVCAFNMTGHLLSAHRHLYMWHLLTASNPRVLMLLDAETLEPAPISLRVGQAVNTVGVAGNPRSVTGFQTHTSPVVIGQGDQAELDQPAGHEDIERSEEDGPRYKCCTSSLEGIVLVYKEEPIVMQAQKAD